MKIAMFQAGLSPEGDGFCKGRDKTGLNGRFC